MTSEDGLGSTREGDLDVLCATVTASCQSQTGVSEAVAQRDGHVEVSDVCFLDAGKARRFMRAPFCASYL